MTTTFDPQGLTPEQESEIAAVFVQIADTINTITASLNTMNEKLEQRIANLDEVLKQTD